MIAHVLSATLTLAIILMICAAPSHAAARTRHALLLLALVRFMVPIALPRQVGNAFAIDLAAVVRSAAAPAAPAFLSGSWLVPAWIGGAVILGIVTLRRHLRFRRRAMAGSVPVLAEVSDREVRSSRGLAEPAVIGIVRPVIVLPALLHDSLDQNELRAVLRHELAHVARRDNASAALARIVCLAFWWNPLVWIAASRMRAEAERACDEAVLDAGTDPSHYVGAIAKVCRGAIGPRPAGISFAHGSPLNERLEGIMSHRTRGSNVHKALIAIAAVLVVAIGIGTAPSALAGRTGGSTTPPVLVKKINPEYTEAAKNARLEGSVVVAVVIDATGDVAKADVIEGFPGGGEGLDQAAVAAVRQWKFTPGKQDGKPVDVKMRLTIKFKLS
ncbi:MAG TPA: M56 family metallopeptidase [Thermoanaerobaculia bacterium]|nr:M56 family metallopeptidase [Thermoanaerobaculia bacterium]